MKKIILLALFSTILLFPSHAVERVIDGYFQGENLYVFNPMDDSGTEFCISSVTVNDKDANSVVNSNAFVIDLKQFGLKKGDALSIVITHKDGCHPKVLNAEILKPQSTFTITSINVNKQAHLQWTTIQESGKIPYTVEQYRWGKWLVLGKVDGQGLTRQNNYDFVLNANENVKPHSGVNLYRVRQIDYKGKARYSLQTKYKSNTDEVSMIYDSKTKIITFSAITSYQVIDELGDLVSEGYGESIEMKKLKKGEYYINFDNNNEKVKRK